MDCDDVRGAADIPLSYTTAMNPAEGPAQATEPISSSQRPIPRWNRTLLALLLLLGTFLLLYRFPAVPVGLHQDEMSEAYEAYSLLHTGADRWGYHLPVYFLSWGSGQNVLQSYLTIPVVAVLGLTRLSARLIPILCGLLTLPLFYFTLRRWFGETTALIGLFLLAISPWHIMESRVGIENSPIPFFILLGVFAFGRALGTRSWWRILPSLLPFALAMYTYGVVVVVIPVLVPLLFLIDLPSIVKAWRAWLSALALFCVASLPIAFFTFKNYVTKRNYGFERWLPFSVPKLTETRLGESLANLNASSIPSHNIHFVLHGFSDEKTVPKTFLPWFQVPGIAPIQAIVLVLAAIAIVVLLVEAVRRRRFTEPFLPWLIACSPLIVLIPLNISRGIAIFVPLLALGAVGCWRVLEWLPKASLRIAATALLAILVLVPAIRFFGAYYTGIYAAEVTPTFNPGLPEALDKALQLAGPGTPIYVTPSIWLNYVQVLFLTKTDPHAFQRSGATTKDPDYGPYRFSRQRVPAAPAVFVFLIKTQDVEQWTAWHAMQERMQESPTGAVDALQRWDALLPAAASDDLQKQMHTVATDSLPQVMQAQRDITSDDARKLDVAPLCAVPEQVVVVGQFLVGRCR